MQDINAGFALESAASGREDTYAPSLQLAKLKARNVIAPSGKAQSFSLVRRLISCVKRLFTGAWLRPQTARIPPLQEVIIAHPAPAPLIFKGGNLSTFVTPGGVYAGKPAAQDLRKVALQRFNRMESSRGETIN